MVRATQVEEFERRFFTLAGVFSNLPEEPGLPLKPSDEALSPMAGGADELLETLHGGVEPLRETAWSKWASAATQGELSSGGKNGSGYCGTELRSVLWRCAAGLLPLCQSRDELLDAWPRTCTALREEYAKLVLNFPLPANDSGATEALELLEEIDTDLERLFPTGCEPADMFAREDSPLREALRRVLFVWARLHPRTGYRQGMHELATPVLYWLDRETSNGNVGTCCPDVSQVESDGKRATSSGIRGILNDDALKREDCLRATLDAVLNANFKEHDLFWIFERLMRDMEPLFLVKQRMTNEEIQNAVQDLYARNKQKNPQILGKSSQQQTKMQPITNKIGCKNSQKNSSAPILELADFVQNDLLAQADTALHAHLISLNVEPQFYALRWLRLLFAREFSINDACIWDALLVDAFKFEERCLTVAATSVDEKMQLVEQADTEAAAAQRTQEVIARGAGPSPCVPVSRGLPLAAACLAVTMILNVRDPLLEGDYSSSLQLLMKYPEVDDPAALVRRAKLLRSQLIDK